ncbi:MAG: citrate synthase [Micrococcaceae bacterium]
MSENKLVVNGNELPLETVPSTIGSQGLNIVQLLKETGDVTYDVGYMNTAACKSTVTYIDGDKGILQYRGYPIEQLAEHSDFIESAYLLIYGELPSAAQRKKFEKDIISRMSIPDEFEAFFKTMPQDGHPMPMLAAAISALSTHYNIENSQDDAQDQEAMLNLLAQVPVLAARILRHTQGEKPLTDTPFDSYTKNFYALCFGTENIDEDDVKALDLLLLLHADHEQNCSTSTVRLIGSSEANLFASVSGGVNALYGPLHGGANEAVLAMLHKIQASGDSVDEYLEKVKNKQDGVRLMGFGHRVYKNYDPRAKIVKRTADTILAKRQEDNLLSLAQELETAALQDDYFVERKLYPNVDFYSGLIYQALGFPERYFTVLFAVGRTPGWIAQWTERSHDPEGKIGRPRQIYVGEVDRQYPQK